MSCFMSKVTFFFNGFYYGIHQHEFHHHLVGIFLWFFFPTTEQSQKSKLFGYTPRKPNISNMEPENHPPWKGKNRPKLHSLSSMLHSFWGCNQLFGVKTDDEDDTLAWYINIHIYNTRLQAWKWLDPPWVSRGCLRTNPTREHKVTFTLHAGGDEHLSMLL